MRPPDNVIVFLPEAFTGMPGINHFLFVDRAAGTETVTPRDKLDTCTVCTLNPDQEAVLFLVQDGSDKTWKAIVGTA